MLAFFGAAAKQNNDLIAVSAEIDAGSGAEIDTVLKDAGADSLGIGEVALYHTDQSRGHWLIVSVLGHFGLSHPEAPAWVLCIGADGHVAVAPADHNHRPLPDTDKPLLPGGSASAQAGEGPYLDFPVASSHRGATDYRV